MSFKSARSLALIAAMSGLLSSCQSVTNVLADPEPNAGPCPSALSLYDAHRIVELRDGEVAYENVGFTGEVLAVRSLCSYYGERPILANLEIDFGFGRGPAAQGRERTYEFFVAITRRDMAVIEKEIFPIRVRFDADEDRVFLTETIDAISIPRADEGTSGTNFEILVGFELTDEQLAFNRSGQRFRVAAGQD
ncbi:hypothetical protein AWH62_14135 [Maricaulis sp. W15]|uniref:Lipoprotein n=1 Tax=Maricaulis maris TaxID=74318 RepID=A0A495DFX8_9PROT|nr:MULTISPECIES: hypothetical protein [Maricaulis]OLF80854.1 hypothetical protein AWH62_14135 [Maricaulis sp. W15]RKR00446.1 hypothetical protein C7435_1654 [Maricaulis maris]